MSICPYLVTDSSPPSAIGSSVKNIPFEGVKIHKSTVHVTGEQDSQLLGGGMVEDITRASSNGKNMKARML